MTQIRHRPVTGVVMVMRITLRYFDGCPHWETALSRLHEVLQETGLAGKPELVLEVVRSQEEAERLQFGGSPHDPRRQRRPVRRRVRTLRPFVPCLRDRFRVARFTDHRPAA
jgi:hypothetical protein